MLIYFRIFYLVTRPGHQMHKRRPEMDVNGKPFLKIRFVVAGGGFYSYYIHQENKFDKESKIVRKKLSFMRTKRSNTFFKRGVQFHD